MKHTLFALALLTGSAQAADIATENQIQFEPIEPAYSLSGIYLGGQAGATAGNYELEIGGLNIDGFGEDGFFGGGQIGVQQVFGNFLLGVEAGAIADNSDHKISFAPIGSISTEEEYLWYLGAKIGVVVGSEERIALYVMPGYETFETDVTLSGGGGSATFSQSYNCFFGRVGADVMATRSIMLGVFGQMSECGGEDWGTSGALDVDKTIVRAGVQASYKFNMPIGN